MYGSEGSELTLAAVGDAIISRRISTCEDERFLDLVDRIRAADAAVVNLEVLLHDYEGYPAAYSGGTYMRAPPWVADELEWAGFNLFAAANNHTGDYSHGGMLATMRELEDRNLAYAGLGRNLAEARSPTYVDTPAGRIALVAACSSIIPGTEAGHQRPDLQGRPGLSPLRWDSQFVVPEDKLEELRSLSENLGLEEAKEILASGALMPIEDEEGRFEFLNPGGERSSTVMDTLSFEVGDEYAVRQEPWEKDVEEILEQVRAAERQADWVIASLHGREGRNGRVNDQTVAEFIESFARDCVDAGADAFVGHGPHLLRGIEIYRDAPIFYSLGNFILQNETITRLPAEIYERYGFDDDTLPAELFDERVLDEDGNPKGPLTNRKYWEGVLPVCEFEDGTLSRIELHPFDLRSDAPRPQRGRPVLATGDRAAEILDDAAERLAEYDTSFVRDGDGTIVIEND